MSGFVEFDLTMFDNLLSRHFSHFNINNFRKFDSSEQKTRQISLNSNQILSDVMKLSRRNLGSRIFSTFCYARKELFSLRNNTLMVIFDIDPCDLESRIFSIFRYAQNGVISVGNNTLISVLLLVARSFAETWKVSNKA